MLFILVLLFLQLLVDAVLSAHESGEKLAIANERLREYALRIEDLATLQERNRIAREIHDSLGHSLTIFNLHLEAALRLLPADIEEATELLKEAKQVGKTALREVRESVTALRADPLKGKILAEAIASLMADFQKSTNISPVANIQISRPIPDDVKIATYRILQEALTNICKYAEATEVKIDLKTQSNIELSIQDNGKGFNLAKNTTGFGLQGMRERTQALGGFCQIITAPSNGCKILISIPLRIL
jgi:signal transduction histidine kinase